MTKTARQKASKSKQVLQPGCLSKANQMKFLKARPKVATLTSKMAQIEATATTTKDKRFIAMQKKHLVALDKRVAKAYADLQAGKITKKQYDSRFKDELPKFKDKCVEPMYNDPTYDPDDTEKTPAHRHFDEAEKIVSRIDTGEGGDAEYVASIEFANDVKKVKAKKQKLGQSMDLSALEESGLMYLNGDISDSEDDESESDSDSDSDSDAETDSDEEMTDEEFQKGFDAAVKEGVRKCMSGGGRK